MATAIELNPIEFGYALPHERWCRYCKISWDVERDTATDEVLNNTDTTCPECDSNDAMKLADAQRAYVAAGGEMGQ